MDGRVIGKANFGLYPKTKDITLDSKLIDYVPSHLSLGSPVVIRQFLLKMLPSPKTPIIFVQNNLLNESPLEIKSDKPVPAGFYFLGQRHKARETWLHAERYVEASLNPLQWNIAIQMGLFSILNPTESGNKEFLKGAPEMVTENVSKDVQIMARIVADRFTIVDVKLEKS